MLSRVADHQYWMSRQIERAENLARLVRVSEEILLDDETLGRGSAQEYWSPVFTSHGDGGIIPESLPCSASR